MGASLASATSRHGLSHRAPCHRRKFDPHFQVIRTNWHPLAEARFFFQLVLKGATTADCALADIRMTAQQRGYMVAQFPEHRRLIEAIYRLRGETAAKLEAMLRASPQRSANEK